MKTRFACILPIVFLTQVCVTAQNNPDCNHLEVISISPVSQFTKLQVTINNRCNDCTSGVSGCVYWELRAIRVVAPFDTIAASQCYCLQTPNNKTSLSYTLNILKPVPLLDSLRISFTCGQDGCDTLAFGMVVGKHPSGERNSTMLYPNPVSDHLTISNIDLRIHKVVITNASGLTLRTTIIEPGKTAFDVYGFEPGLYFITGYDKKGNRFPTLKFAKD